MWNWLSESWNYVWIYDYEADWDQDGVLLETWFLLLWHLNTMFGEGLKNFSMIFL